MPPKITSKNLSYDASAPPFLAALRARASGQHGPDPILAAQRRSGKKRSSSEEAEDVPLVVDEDGNVVNLEVDKDGTVKDDQEYGGVVEGKEEAVVKEQESKSAIGGRKRKVGKVVGEAAEEDGGKMNGKDDKEKSQEENKNRKPKKKAKKIKLSFDEDEG